MDQVIETTDGRRLCIEVTGDPDGDVIVVHHGTPSSRLLYPPRVADAVARGARLVGYDRPGYGASTRHPERSVADAADDLRAIASALGVDRLVTWGHSGGGPHALACAALAPDLVVAAAALASVAPYGPPDLDFFEGMGEFNVEHFRLALDDPEAATAKASAETAAALDATPDELLVEWATILSPTDVAAFSGNLASYLVEAMRLGLGAGPEGYIDDGFCFVRPWGFNPADITVPVQVWYGRDDLMVPFDHGHWLAGHIPSAEAHPSETDGHLTLLDHVPDVHAWLLAALRAA